MSRGAISQSTIEGPVPWPAPWRPKCPYSTWARKSRIEASLRLPRVSAKMPTERGTEPMRSDMCTLARRASETFGEFHCQEICANSPPHVRSHSHHSHPSLLIPLTAHVLWPRTRRRNPTSPPACLDGVTYISNAIRPGRRRRGGWGTAGRRGDRAGRAGHASGPMALGHPSGLASAPRGIIYKYSIYIYIQ